MVSLKLPLWLRFVLLVADFPRYRALFEETRCGLAKLGVALLTVQENGNVQKWGLT
jgi:hypothetical protein